MNPGRPLGCLEYTPSIRGEMAYRVNTMLENQKVVAEAYGADERTVKLWATRQLEDPENRLWAESRPRSGRKRCLTEFEEIEIVQGVFEEPFHRWSYPLEAALVYDCSQTTVTRVLNKYGIKYRIPAKKFELTERHKVGRLAFANDYIDHDLEYWSNMIFTDEKTFKSDQCGRVYLYRLDNERYCPENILEVASSGRVSVCLWGWFTGITGTGQLIDVEGTFNSLKYIEILEEALVPELKYRYESVDQWKFMHDNSGVHTAKIVNYWFENQNFLQKIDWAPYMPDVNPQENIWGWLSNKWEIRAEDKVRENLVSHARQYWDYLKTAEGRQICRNLSDSVPRRLEDVKKAGGGHIKY